MIRKPFAFASLLTALSIASMCAGTLGTALAQDAPVQSIYVDSYVGSSSWANSPTGANLTYYFQCRNVSGNVSGTFMMTGAGFTNAGSIVSEADYIDVAGQHLQVSAKTTFRRPGSAPVQATTVFKALIMADGSQWEGVSITDASGKVLFSTGTDSNGLMQLYQLTRGSLFICH